MLSSVSISLSLAAIAILPCSAFVSNSSFLNPILPGWHSDPSCTIVREWDDIYLCTTSTFIAFPGLPIYASHDLINWKHASNALSRVDQIPDLAISAPAQQEGTYANTLRYHDGKLYLITTYLSSISPAKILLFSTSDPFDDAAWSNPLEIENPSGGGDPDIFWDDDGKFYVTQNYGGEHGSFLTSEVDIVTGNALQSATVWNGTGGRWPEGPHVYKKDGWYYLLVAEGGTETLHKVTIARSREILGPYEGYEGNPILTNSDTDEYFQCVGHADLFQDTDGNWWGVALATRSGPEWQVYPMGRETVLYSVRWGAGEWPVMEPVRGHMSGPLPPSNMNVPGTSPWITANTEMVDFEAGSQLPPQWHQWRAPTKNLFTISPPERPNTLRVTPSQANLTANATFDPRDGLAFIGRVQSHTVFHLSVDVSFTPLARGAEAGITLFLTQYQHIDLGIVGLSPCSNSTDVTIGLRYRATTFGKPEAAPPNTSIKTVPKSWLDGPIRLMVHALNDTQYVFSAASVSRPEEIVELGTADAFLLSGGSGPFTGTLIGLFATTNGKNGNTPAYFGRWRYTGIAQKVANNEYVYI